MSDDVLPLTTFECQLEHRVARFSAPLPQASIALFEEYFDKNDRVFIVTAIEVSIDGLTLDGARGVLRYEPPIWRERFWPWVRVEASVVFRGVEAVKLMMLYKLGFLDIEARKAVAALRNNEITFEDIRDQEPVLITHPLIQKEWATCFCANKMPRRSPGKRAVILKNEVELYTWACHYFYANPQWNFIEACSHAVKQHPGLVPKTWKVYEGQAGNLQKLAKRCLDSSPYSQLSLREGRKPLDPQPGCVAKRSRRR